MSYYDCRMVSIAFIAWSRIKWTHYLISEVSELRALEYFSCNKNQLSELPIALGNCQNLIEFIIDENYSLREIPPRIFALKYLTYLSANSEFEYNFCLALIPVKFKCVPSRMQSLLPAILSIEKRRACCENLREHSSDPLPLGVRTTHTVNVR